MNLIPQVKNREAYIQKIKPFINKSLVKVIIGQRRVGKSYLLFQLIEFIEKTEVDPNIIYINLEDFAFREIKTAENLHHYLQEKISVSTRNYIFIDEIQTVEAFEDVIRSLLLNPLNDVYITGSNAQFLSGEIATRLAGRSVVTEVLSLSYKEFLDFHGLDSSKETLLNYLKWGGLPYLIHLEKTDEVIFEYLKNVYNSIVYRDIVARNQVRNSLFLEDLVRYLADATGSLFSANKISQYLKSQKIQLSHVQVKNYLQHLTDAHIIHLVSRYDIIGKKHFETGEKYYFENLGIRNVLTGFKPNDLHKLLENAVYNHLRYLGFTIKVGFSQTLEIDFVAVKNNERVYLQVALKIESEKTQQREFGNLIHIKDSWPKYVITFEDSYRNSVEGIKTMSLEEFLLHFDE